MTLQHENSENIQCEFEYSNESISITKEIVFIDKKQHILVKTWEKLEQKSHDKNVCYIKTLRVYDSHNHIVKEILTEQVWTVVGICVSHLYDSSVRVYRNKIYFFKRINKRLAANSSDKGGISLN